MKAAILCALVVLTTSCVVCHGLSLYDTTGHKQLATGANPAVTVVTNEIYEFYGKPYTHICISDNGFLSFGNPVASNSPKIFPVTEGSYSIQTAAFIAPYWSDVDIRNGGNIYYHVTTDSESELLEMLGNHVQLSGAGQGFNPKEAVIVTWKDVASGGADGKVNTFQIALVTDGVGITYAIFRYDKLEWHTSTYSATFHRGPATAGGNAGDKTNGWNLRSTLLDPKDIVKLTEESNVGFSGVFVYRVDLGPSMEIQVRLMANMMLFAQEARVAEVEEAELYSPNSDLPLSYFHRASAEMEMNSQNHHNDFEVRRPSRPYIQNRDEEVNALSYELQRIKY